MTLRRIALSVLVVLATTFSLTTLLHATTSSAQTVFPIYSYINSGVGALPWDGQTSSQLTNNTLMIGAPHSITNSTEGVVAYLTSKKDIALYTLPASGTPGWANYSAGYNVPTPSSDPVPFFDPSGAVDMLYAADVRGVPVSDIVMAEALRAASEPERESSWLYARDIVDGVVENLTEIDEAISSNARGWTRR